MADYYSLLNNTIGKLANNTPDNRAIVYGKARAAIDRKLRAMEPTPTEEAIARQMELLEEAIERMEADHGGATTMAPVPPQPAPSVPAAPPAPAEPASPEVEAHLDGPPESTHSSASHDHDHQSRPLAGSPVKDGHDNYSADFSTTGHSDEAVSDQVSGHEHEFGHEYGRDDEVGTGETTVNHGMMFDEPSHVGADEADLAPPEMPAYASGRKKKKGALGKIIAFLIGVGVIAGGGYFVWANYDGDVSKMVDSMSSSLTGSGNDGASNDASTSDAGAADTAESSDGKDATAGDEGVDKENARLGNDGETVAGDPVENSDNSEPVKEDAPVILDQTNPLDSNASEAADGQQGQQGAAEDSKTPVVADKAFLYTEATGGQGANLSNGNVVWKLEGTPADPVIHAEMDVPNLGLVMNLDIKRNEDASLSASHLIDLNFTVPPDFEGRNVDNVARFVMKDSEQAVGNPLIGVPAKILDGTFIIALDNLDKAKEVNKSLMLNSNWIDIPLAFSTGVRGLVTLEKGANGEEVFKKAFDAWDKAGN